MRSTRVRSVVAASLAIGLLAGACGDDDDDAAATSTTVEETTDEETTDTAAIEVTLTADGLEGMPEEVPAGVVEITLTNETGDFASLDISRVADGTTEEEFVEGILPVFEGGPFPDFFESNAGIEADDAETTTSLVILREGEHIAWFQPPSDESADEAEEPAEEEPPAEEPAEDEGEGGSGAPPIVTQALTVTAGDADAELPEADGEIVATDYEFDATLDGPGTINFRNDGPQQFHHAVLVDFGTNDPAAVGEAFPAILESEGDPSTLPDVGIDMEQVNFDFGGSGVFGPDGAAGTFEADIVEGNTYVLACFIQDRSGGPPHAVAYDMWEVVQAGDAGTTTTEG